MQSKQPNIQLTQHYVKKVLGTYIKRALKSFQKVKSNFSHNTNLLKDNRVNIKNLKFSVFLIFVRSHPFL